MDAFTESAFKGNPAAVCLLKEEEEREEGWFQSVATEFNISETCFLTPIATTHSEYSTNPRFHLRWFTPVAEVSPISIYYVLLFNKVVLIIASLSINFFLINVIAKIDFCYCPISLPYKDLD